MAHLVRSRAVNYCIEQVNSIAMSLSLAPYPPPYINRYVYNAVTLRREGEVAPGMSSALQEGAQPIQEHDQMATSGRHSKESSQTKPAPATLGLVTDGLQGYFTHVNTLHGTAPLSIRRQYESWSGVNHFILFTRSSMDLDISEVLDIIPLLTGLKAFIWTSLAKTKEESEARSHLLIGRCGPRNLTRALPSASYHLQWLCITAVSFLPATFIPVHKLQELVLAYPIDEEVITSLNSATSLKRFCLDLDPRRRGTLPKNLGGLLELRRAAPFKTLQEITFAMVVKRKSQIPPIFDSRWKQIGDGFGDRRRKKKDGSLKTFTFSIQAHEGLLPDIQGAWGDMIDVHLKKMNSRKLLNCNIWADNSL
ncbi:hypothetical protein BDN72DRAFT_525351 [Pluteus cervinus]|uniref:Uncharacterized protein n=1 Tax=Pluteus cervinus TaxID=181527 RepID=A0ACD3AZ87_9AGAR|nr:hypothetical protein BDN72DRAFT_525351 [Pluteus cervinus]